MNAPHISEDHETRRVTDVIVQKIFPILGILLIAGGLSYLFYTGLWDGLTKTGRLALGFIAGIAFVAGGMSFGKRLKYFADVLIGGGVILLYITLIYGSRFEHPSEILIPESATLLISLVFSLVIAGFSYARNTQVILALGLCGGYLTPFFIGQVDSWEYAVPFWNFLLYFVAINGAVMFISHRLFLKEIMLLNSIGLFVGTNILSVYHPEGFQQTLTFSSLAVVALAGLHIWSVAITSRRFEDQNNPYLIAGYLLPLFWCISVVGYQVEFAKVSYEAGIYGILSAIYFGAWYYVRNVSRSDRHFPLYFGGIVSLWLGLMVLSPSLDEYNGIFLSAVAVVFGGLHILKPLVQRIYSFFFLAILGLFFTLENVGTEMIIGSFGPLEMSTIFLSLSLVPFALAYFFRPIGAEKNGIEVLSHIAAVVSSVIIGLMVGADIFTFFEVPAEFMTFSLPAFILVLLVPKYPQYSPSLLVVALLLGMIGFFPTFVEFLDRIYPPPLDVLPFMTRESFIGIAHLGLFFLLHLFSQKYSEEKRPSFLPTFCMYTALFLLVTHELTVLYNYDFQILSFLKDHTNGYRAFTLTVWWAGLGTYLTFMGSKKEGYLNEKILGIALIAITLLKIFLYDLSHIDTNFKVFALVIVGSLLLGVSYYANVKKLKSRPSAISSAQSKSEFDE